MNDVFNRYNSVQLMEEFDTVAISVASPEQIKNWSYGEVRKPETINYRSLKPEKDGLFCSRIFGPEKDYECQCGKYKRMKYKGIVCEKCGVEVTLSKVRRERMGHIDLAAPVAHIWFLKSSPSRIGHILELPMRDLEKVLYFESYIVIEPGLTKLSYKQLLTEEEYQNALDEFGDETFEVSIGAEALQKLLEHLDLEVECVRVRELLDTTNSDAKRRKYIKQLKILESFRTSKVKPEWMILSVLPVIPPDLRPLVQLDGGRFASSDLNDLYRRVINRNNRLKRLIDLGAPEIILRNEKRMLQEAVDTLLDNSRTDKTYMGANKRPLKSLTDMLKGKQGRFRQNLLGKRVDYSGRSVIVVGPELGMHQCGLPKSMAKELFKPFIYSQLLIHGHASTMRVAKRMVDEDNPVVWDIVAEVIHEHPILLNRAPTLHRLGIQAFEPKLIEGKAIRLHPLVCVAFNADFDGDQMAVHIPLSIEAQLEARILMMSTRNLLSPSNGRPVISPTHDIVLGLYYLSIERHDLLGEEVIFDDEKLFKTAIQNQRLDLRVYDKTYRIVAYNKKDVHKLWQDYCDKKIRAYYVPYYSSMDEVRLALDKKKILLQSPIVTDWDQVLSDGTIETQKVRTTPGRMMIIDKLPRNFHITIDTVNRVFTKRELGKLIDVLYRFCGNVDTVKASDALKNLGFTYACLSGISLGKDDLVIPRNKKVLIDRSLDEVKQLDQQYMEGLMTYQEKYNKLVDVWSKCSDAVAKEMMKELEKPSEKGIPNSVYMMANSGARSSEAQLRQLAGMRGLMAKPSGEIIETPIISNFKEGLTELEYFNSTHGARKGLADTALKTANSGYLTRRLVDVAQEVIIREMDCGTDKGVDIEPLMDGGELIEGIGDRILGRTLLADVVDPKTGEILAIKNQQVNDNLAELIGKRGITLVSVRSPLTCESDNGVCGLCYGWDLARGEQVEVGVSVGIIAAQSIGEPGTQLTMRTFHIGGAAQGAVEQNRIESSYHATVHLKNVKLVMNSEGKNIVMNRHATFDLIDESNAVRMNARLPYGSILGVKDKGKVEPGDVIATWDPYTMPILTEKDGIAHYTDLIEGTTFSEVVDDVTGMSNRVVTNWQQGPKTSNLKPRITLRDENENIITLDNGLEARYFMSERVILTIDDNQHVKAGDVIARIPRESSKTRDITGGLPRISELFEARKPKESAIIVVHDGVVSFGKDYKTKKRIIITPEDGGDEHTYMIPKERHLLVQEGDFVTTGDKLVDGDLNPHDILEVLGVKALAEYLIKEIQDVYRMQGVFINDKHFEIIIRRMLQKFAVIDPKGSLYIQGDQIDRFELLSENHRLEKEGKEPATYQLILQGITKASINTYSFISAASFQETTRVLADAAVNGKQDYLTGLKENVIVGNLIPAGSGLTVRRVKKSVLDAEKV